MAVSTADRAVFAAAATIDVKATAAKTVDEMVQNRAHADVLFLLAAYGSSRGLAGS